MLKMIDIAAAARTMAQIEIGSDVEYELDALTFSRKVLEKSLYSLTVQGPTNRLTFPVDVTTIYKKEVEDMPRAPMPTETKKRGRPLGSRNVAPVEQPQTGYVPAAGAPQPAYPTSPAFPTPVQQTGHTASPEPKEMPIQAAEGSENWVEEALDELLDKAREDFLLIIGNAQTQQAHQEINADKPPGSHTCYTCINVNVDAGKCGKWDMIPPMAVQCNAKVNCPDYVWDEIPF